MKKLYRPESSAIGGVCSGIGDYFNVDVTIVRILFALLFITPFPIFIFYLLMWIIIPSES